jgi:diacylglycerol O-acyltransferase / wax synthase
MPSITIERAGPMDLMELASDVGPAPMQVAAVLMLEGSPTPEAVREALADRIRGIPRLRQRLVRVRPGCGRPIWVDDPDFRIEEHVHVVHCAAPGDQTALFDVAARTVTHRLPGNRPLWAATVVTGLTDNASALIVVFHHVLADGIGGLAVLAQLADGAATGPEYRFPRPRPSDRDLVVDATRSRLQALRGLPAQLRRLRGGAKELSSTGGVRPPRTSLNKPTGPRRGLAVAHADLATIHAVAHAYDGTVNDVVLTAVTGALYALLRSRGETIDHIVLSVPVSARRAASVTQLGNQIGMRPLALPAGGEASDRLARIVGITHTHRGAPRAASAGLLAPTFRLLALLGVLKWFINRQHLLMTFVTNLRGPESRLSFLGTAIGDVIPVGTTTGNVTVAFAVLSYAGTLNVTVVADPDACPDYADLALELQRELESLASLRHESEPQLYDHEA